MTGPSRAEDLPPPPGERVAERALIAQTRADRRGVTGQLPGRHRAGSGLTSVPALAVMAVKEGGPPEPAPSPYRAMCLGMLEVSCRESARNLMAAAIAECAGAECFAIGRRQRLSRLLDAGGNR